MSIDLDWFPDLPPSLIRTAIAVAATILASVVVIKLILAVMRRTVLKNATEHNRLLVQNLVAYAATAIIGMAILGELGVDVKTLLGAAGIVGIALGFASQTSVSNIISGLFLLGEKPFAVGDVIKVGDKTGVILSIDLMSIKIRTFDNLFIRLPNTTVLNTEVVNVTRFPIRRLDFTIQVAYKEDLGRVREVLERTVRENPFALREPEPVVLIQGFGQSGIDMFIGAWFLKSDFVALKNSLFQSIKERLDAEGIEIPFPHAALYAGSATGPFPIKIVGGPEPD